MHHKTFSENPENSIPYLQIGLATLFSAVNSGSCAGKPKLPGDFVEKTWLKLQIAVKAVHEKQPVSCSLEDLYRVSMRESCEFWDHTL